ncbi:HD domain-containing protein [Bacteriovorax sp. Seq25_V]|uniref:HD domain-containing protein n=1 Tax=Bacteriovorax sp. Seq25_V TaxID=1201288 RepID=UPI000389F729|nr:HD domain-containing protein [Bacteriovorax sp. Seq25_V]EQC46260.1 HD domain protein [Bacteriovorax sp. Seq25_V]
MKNYIISNSKLTEDSFETIKNFYLNDDPAHDWLHIQRLLKQGIDFGTHLGASLSILLPAILIHDIINIPKGSRLRSKASLLSANKTKELLGKTDYTDKEIESIAQVVLEHSYSANLPATSLESEILQDIDKLDAMGAIGVMRWAATSAKMKSKFYDEDNPWAEGRELNDFQFALDHFETKLLKLEGRLNTEIAKKEGQKRLQFFYEFLSQLKAEI